MNIPLVAVGGIILREDKILLIKRGHEPNKGMWAVPGGKVKFGESIEQAVKREVSEETNLNVKIEKLAAIVEAVRENYHYVIFDYVSSVVNGEASASSDAKEVRFFPLSEAIRLPMTPTMYPLIKALIEKVKFPIVVRDLYGSVVSYPLIS
ncbi:DNA mismatch repair protein MutT [Sulfolobales archaeon HS-7]|nr:DNA mismatch repair protein MutT [Sulfolobales archaeon HS-7]